MASKQAVKTKSSEPGAASGGNEAAEGEAPLLDSIAEAVKRMIRRAKERGYVTVDELNKTLPTDQVGSEQIEDIMAQLSEMGINVTEGEESEETAEGGQPAEASEETASFGADEAGRTDDPVRLYLREMGSVELLSREGEIAIAKRIEAGREMMIAGICESPLTIQAILAWNDSLKEGKLLLRDIIDLDATSGGTPGSEEGADFSEAAGPEAEAPEPQEGAEGASEDAGFDDEGNVSLSALEEKLKPQVIETFDKIGSTWSKLSKAAAARQNEIKADGKPSKATEAKYVRLKGEMIDIVRTVRFSNARIEQLVQQLYTLNRRLMGLEGQLLRLAMECGVERESFLANYYGHELGSEWIEAGKNPKPQAAQPPAPPAAPPAPATADTGKPLASAKNNKPVIVPAPAPANSVDTKPPPHSAKGKPLPAVAAKVPPGKPTPPKSPAKGITKQNVVVTKGKPIGKSAPAAKAVAIAKKPVAAKTVKSKPASKIAQKKR